MLESGPTPSIARRACASVARFVKLEFFGGILLLAAASVALVWANSPWAASYEVWDSDVSLGMIAGHHLPIHDVRFWINDGLMTLFFFAVGLEIRTEIHAGSLRSLRLAALPFAAAAGGVIVPALIYIGIAGRDVELQHGWAVPTATDIAFAIGVLSMLGSRIPGGLRVLLLALAIIDDIVAILVIGFYYSDNTGITVHPTLVAVGLGLLVPVARSARSADRPSPSARLGALLHPWVAYAILPLFALANAGVVFDGFTAIDERATTLMFAVLIALALGKPLGIIGGCVLAIRLGLAALPAGTNWRGIALIGCLGGIGFTMSIFIAALAFPDPRLLGAAKLAILIGSAASAIAGLIIGLVFLKRAPRCP